MGGRNTKIITGLDGQTLNSSFLHIPRYWILIIFYQIENSILSWFLQGYSSFYSFHFALKDCILSTVTSIVSCEQNDSYYNCFSLSIRKCFIISFFSFNDFIVQPTVIKSNLKSKNHLFNMKKWIRDGKITKTLYTYIHTHTCKKQMLVLPCNTKIGGPSSQKC